MTPTFFDTLLGYVGSFVDSAFVVGNKLITWITTSGHEIVLIPIICFLLVMFVGIIRKLVKGV